MKYLCLFIFLNCALPFCGLAQTKSGNDRTLFSAGFASAFVAGLYDAYYPYRQLECHGNFGLGAPDKLDGEVIMLNGKLYQTHYSGKTESITDTGKTPYAVVCFFKPEMTFKPDSRMNKMALFAYLDSVLSNKNGLYAIHISGRFNYIKTRAFPPVQKPYVPLTAMLDKQHFFEFRTVTGDLAGYRLPAFMEGPHISGYHFHFLSEDKSSGGHMIDLITDNITIEVETLNSYAMVLPETTEFNNFDFKKDRKDEIKSVENGKKP